jgi:hypothetical protein
VCFCCFECWFSLSAAATYTQQTPMKAQSDVIALVNVSFLSVCCVIVCIFSVFVVFSVFSFRFLFVCLCVYIRVT